MPALAVPGEGGHDEVRVVPTSPPPHPVAFDADGHGVQAGPDGYEPGAADLHDLALLGGLDG